jgi:hypothetical protein
MRDRIAIGFFLALSLVAGTATVAYAGQPSVECDDFSSTPGNSASARGSAFAEDGISGTVYAGEQPQNSVNVHSVSQYDVACRNVSQ